MDELPSPKFQCHVKALLERSEKFTEGFSINNVSGLNMKLASGGMPPVMVALCICVHPLASVTMIG